MMQQLDLFADASRWPKRPYCSDDKRARYIRSLASALGRPYIQANLSAMATAARYANLPVSLPPHQAMFWIGSVSANRLPDKTSSALPATSA